MDKYVANMLAEEALSKGAIQKGKELAELVIFLADRHLGNVLEIGTARGGTFWLWCQLAAAKANIISVDLPGGDFGGGYTTLDTALYRTYAKDQQSLHFIMKNSQEFSTYANAVSILGGDKLDMLFIDGDHTYDGVVSDFKMYAPLVSEKGLIVFHDIVRHTKGTRCAVDALWTKIKTKFAIKEFIDEHHNEEGAWGGIGVIEFDEKSYHQVCIDL